jgi:hypothetical protein
LRPNGPFRQPFGKRRHAPDAIGAPLGYTRAVSDPTDPLEAAWCALEPQWDDATKHKAFVALAASLGRLPDAAARYNTASQQPARAQAAEQGRQLVLAAALAQLATTPHSARAQSMGRGMWLAPLAALGLLFALGALLATVTQNRVFVSLPALAVEMLIVAVLPWRRLVR